MDKVVIRRAAQKDCVKMLELIKELADYENALEEVILSLEQFTEDGFGKSPLWGAFVGECENEIVGMALFYNRYSTWKGKRLYLEDLVVTEKWRGKKVGKQLFEATIDHARSNNYNGMVFQVLNWNEPAINFYKKYSPKFDDEWFNVSIDF